MYERLASCRLPVDELLSELVQKESLDQAIRILNPRLGKWPIEFYVSLEMVMHPKLRDAARKYISKLLEEKEKYGYIYYLSGQSLLMPLAIQFRGIELFTETEERDRITKAIEALASEFACRSSIIYEITMVEIYYFFIRLVNPKLSWLAVEYMINSVKLHAHLLMSSERKFTWAEDKELDAKINKDKLLFCTS